VGRFISIPLLLLAAALQASVIPQIRIGGGGPDLVFLMVLSWAVNTDLGEGLLWAFVGGIMEDLLSAAPLGTSTLAMIPIVFFISGLNRQVYRMGFLLLTTLVLLGTVFQQVVIIIVLSLTGHLIELPSAFGFIVAPTIVYNFLLIWPVYFVMRRIQQRLGGDKAFFS
jgi:rod shape-determining protein MreD